MERLFLIPQSLPGPAGTWQPAACESRAVYAPRPVFPKDGPVPALWRGQRAHGWRQESGPKWSWWQQIPVYGFGGRNRRRKAALARESPKWNRDKAQAISN